MIDADELPEGWASCSVLDLCHAVRGVSYSKGEASRTPEKGLVPIVRANNIDGELTFEDLQFVPQARVSKDQRLRVGDVVIAMSSGSKSVVGKAASVTKPWTGAFGAFCGVLRPCSEIEARHFGLFFQTVAYRKTISDASAGTNINNLKREHFAAISFPIPPLAEQQRIVAKVEALLARVNAARQRLAKAPAILKRFRQSVLAAACSGRLTADWRKNNSHIESASDLLEEIGAAKETLPKLIFRKSFPDDHGDGMEEGELPESWARVKLHEVCSHIADIDHKMPKAAEAGVKFLSAKDLLDDGTLNFTDNVKLISEDDYKRLSRKIMPIRNDIIYSRIGACLGKARLVETDERFLVSYSCCVIRPLFVDPAYLGRFLDSGAVLNRARNYAKSIGVPDLGLSEISEFRIPIPPRMEQHEIVRRVEALFKLADAIEKRVAAATVRAEKLTQAILAKAFRGELVPTEAELARRKGRDYEPASVLLERIKSSTDCTDSTDLKKRKKR